jgi:predicted Zn-ribbon and HTH transcriptional regulator
VRDLKCPLCGYEFTEEEMEEERCRSCPLGKGCEILCCPNCGYRFMEESKILNTIKRIFEWRKR